MIRVWAILVGAALAAGPGAAQAGGGPAVLELFTSQGCYSCPPADKFLGRLKQRKDVIALSMHVTYWDRLGWRDPFGKARHDRRQKRYGRRLDVANVYTPQLVIDGRRQAVGSRTSTVRARLADALAEPNPVQPQLAGKAEATLVLPASDVARPAQLWLVTYDRRHKTQVTAGENEGETLINHNVVRGWYDLGRWSGKPARRDLPLAAARQAGRDGFAVLVQARPAGRILGAVADTFAKS